MATPVDAERTFDPLFYKPGVGGFLDNPAPEATALGIDRSRVYFNPHGTGAYALFCCIVPAWRTLCAECWFAACTLVLTLAIAHGHSCAAQATASSWSSCTSSG